MRRGPGHQAGAWLLLSQARLLFEGVKVVGVGEAGRHCPVLGMRSHRIGLLLIGEQQMAAAQIWVQQFNAAVGQWHLLQLDRRIAHEVSKLVG